MKNFKITFTIALLFSIGIVMGQSRRESCNCVRLVLDHQETYILNAWTLEDTPSQVITYSSPAIKIKFLDGQLDELSSQTFTPSGPIIDGWQKIAGKLDVPENYAIIEFELQSNGFANDVYFDDIRIHPKNSNFKSFTYDPVTFRLMAEMDENNYATFYEYDKEGGLVRVKKETEDGVYTIQETRSKTSIKQ
ncbi:MAG: hypothetical protein KTR22_10325 [Flavobacteriaceae bacterium]|nr:hypothetical protein [Flavobacteriaceae bacterium]